MIKVDLMFRLMIFILRIRDTVAPLDKRVDRIGLKKGNTIIDYGCGSGGYLRRAAELVGENGKVYAVDSHRLSIKTVKRLIEKYELRNVEPILADEIDGAKSLSDNVADIILAMDMFHMVKEKNKFLRELHRLVKKEGILIIEPGHMSSADAKEKILEAGVWRIEAELENFLKCVPI